MSKLIHITDEQGGLSLPLDVITLRQAIYGTSGSGKTTYARLLAEKVHEARHRFCAIDLKNDWYGLKSSADGQAAGIPVVIFGGPRADVKLYDDAGAAVADTVTSIEQSVIVDLDDLSKGKQLRFLTAFLERLYDVNRAALLLICDEADRYAAQKPMSPEAIQSLGAAEDVCRRGRKRGLGSTWLTQRTAVLNKNVSDICDLTVVFRTPGARDLKELEDRIARVASKEHTAEVMRLAPGLADGEAIFLSSHPKLRGRLPHPPRPLQLPMPWTFDSSATPGVGQRRREPKVLAETDLAAIEQRMKQQVERAKAEDPRELRKTIEMQRKLLAEFQRDAKRDQERVKTAESRVKEKRVDVPVIKESQIARLEKLHDRAQERAEFVMKKLADVVNPLSALLHGERAEIGKLLAAARAVTDAAKPATNPQTAPVIARTAPIIPRRTESPSRTPARASSHATNGDAPSEAPSLGSSGKRRILVALAQHPDGLTARKLSILTDIAMGGGTWRTYMAELRGAGWVEGDRSLMKITRAGLDALGPFDPLPIGDALIDYWRRRLGDSGKRKLFDAAVAAYPGALTKDELAEQTGIAQGGGTWRTYMAELRGLQLLTGKGQIKASDELFE